MVVVNSTPALLEERSRRCTLALNDTLRNGAQSALNCALRTVSLRSGPRGVKTGPRKSLVVRSRRARTAVFAVTAQAGVNARVSSTR